MSFYDKILQFKDAGEVYVIAEVGSNVKSKQDMVNSVQFAKNCGADAVKFQYFDESELFGPISRIRKDNPLEFLKQKADAVGIDLLCSAFSPEGMLEIDKFLPAHKIASSEMTHIRMLETVKELKKPLILSTGGFFPVDIQKALEFLGEHPTIIMHCNLSYPARFTDIDKYLKILEMWKGPVGYSDHTVSVDAVPYMYRANGVCVYEKHFNPFGYTDTPDAPHSLNTKEFKTMVSYIRGAPSPYSEENEGRLKHIRRVVATTDIKVGDIFKENENMGIFRSRNPDDKGISPLNIDKLEGKRSTKNIKQGEGISLNDIR